MNQKIKNIVIAFVSVLAFSGTSMAQTKAAAFKVPAYEKFTLPNGLTVYLMEQHEVPTISISAIVPAGAIYDGEKSGLASLTATGLQYALKAIPKRRLSQSLILSVLI